MHGDFCFNNILYNSRAAYIKVIDPHGFIVAGAGDGYRFAIAFLQTAQHAWLETALGELSIDGIPAAGIKVRAIMTGLFLAMLPLHADRPDRQPAFIANALRLYAALEEE